MANPTKPTKTTTHHPSHPLDDEDDEAPAPAPAPAHAKQPPPQIPAAATASIQAPPPAQKKGDPAPAALHHVVAASISSPGHWRAGHFWSVQPASAEVTEAQLKELSSDSRIMIFPEGHVPTADELYDKRTQAAAEEKALAAAALKRATADERDDRKRGR